MIAEDVVAVAAITEMKEAGTDLDLAGAVVNVANARVNATDSASTDVAGKAHQDAVENNNTKKNSPL
jgi:hypothetical protein